MAYRPHTAAETFALLDIGGQTARVATGNFLDDFYRANTPEEKYALVQKPLPEVKHPENLRWAGYLAAATAGFRCPYQTDFRDPLGPATLGRSARGRETAPYRGAGKYLGARARILRDVQAATTRPEG